MEIPAGDGWSLRWDNTVTTGIGMRVRGIDPKLGNNPLFQNSEYKFPHAGSIVTSRVGLYSEFDAINDAGYGFRLSADGWKDFAYSNRSVATNPGNFGPGLPYALFSSQQSGRYDSYTSRYYSQGAQLDDAFAFWNASIADVPTDFKIGRFTEYWGNALYTPYQGVSYSQGPVDGIKATASPGAQIKELFMPRTQLSVRSQLSREWSVGAQYAFEWRPSRLPEGGTFLGVADPFFIGPRSAGGAAAVGGIDRGDDVTPRNFSGNFGVQARWRPEFLDGTVGVYFRRFDEVMPFGPALVGVNPATGATNYHLAYAKGVNLYGLSFEKAIGSVSAGIEMSYRQGTALNTVPAGGVNFSDPEGREGARGNTFNMVANAIYGLPRTSLFDTGTAIAELSFTSVLDVTRNRSLYQGIGYACSDAAGAFSRGQGRADGCSTRNNLAATISADPQWLQVLPGVDLDMPMTVSFGLLGNGQYMGTASNGFDAGTVSYTIGLNADIRQKYKVKLAYNGYYAPSHLTTTNLNGQPYTQTGRGNYMWNDRHWVSLVFQTSF